MSDELRSLAAGWRKEAIRLFILSRHAETQREQDEMVAKMRAYFDCSYDLDDLIGEDISEPEEGGFFTEDELPEDPGPQHILGLEEFSEAWVDQLEGGEPR